MGYGVHGDGAGLAGVGRTTAGGHLVAQEGAGPIGAEPFLGLPDTLRAQDTVQLRRADGPKLFLNLGGERPVVALVVLEPFGQGGLEQLAAELIAVPPDKFERGQQLDRIVGELGPGTAPIPGGASDRLSRRRALLR
jgi:hypothetical protein